MQWRTQRQGKCFSISAYFLHPAPSLSLTVTYLPSAPLHLANVGPDRFLLRPVNQNLRNLSLNALVRSHPSPPAILLPSQLLPTTFALDPPFLLLPISLHLPPLPLYLPWPREKEGHLNPVLPLLPDRAPPPRRCPEKPAQISQL